MTIFVKTYIPFLKDIYRSHRRIIQNNAKNEPYTK